MQVKQFRYGEDNLGYLIYGKKYAAVLDGGAVQEILFFLHENNLELRYVLNTHMHPDHTMGNKKLLEATSAEQLEISDLIERWSFKLEGNEIRVYHTPGHTNDSIIYYFNYILLSGDTLLVGKVGRCFTGNTEIFLRSIKLLLTLPLETVVYGGHDYVREYMATAKLIEPDNPHIDKFLEKYNPHHVVSTINEELKINPTLRFNDKKMISILRDKGLPHNSELDCWRSLLSLTQGG